MTRREIIEGFRRNRLNRVKVPERIKDLRESLWNPREIGGEAIAGLKVSLTEFGDLSGIVWNARTGELVSGHQRMRSLRELYEDELRIEDGSVVTPDGERFKIRVVDWDEDTAKAANVAANNPAIGGEFTADVADIIKDVWEAAPELAEGLLFADVKVPDFEVDESLLEADGWSPNSQQSGRAARHEREQVEVDFKFGDVVGKVGRGVYDRFVTRYGEPEHRSKILMDVVGEMVDGWIGSIAG